jgi:hypothetical protein
VCHNRDELSLSNYSKELSATGRTSVPGLRLDKDGSGRFLGSSIQNQPLIALCCAQPITVIVTIRSRTTPTAVQGEVWDRVKDGQTSHRSWVSLHLVRRDSVGPCQRSAWMASNRVGLASCLRLNSTSCNVVSAESRPGGSRQNSAVRSCRFDEVTE